MAGGSPKIDSHQHFIQYNPTDYPWIGKDMQALKRNFLPRDLRACLDDAGFDGSVAVQARQSLEETELLLRLADEEPFIRGVVGWVDLRSPALPAELARLVARSGESAEASPGSTGKKRRLAGVRHVVHDEPDDDFLLREDVLRGIGELAQFELAYDFLLFPKHLSRAIRVADMFPGQRFVLDHIGKPPIREGRMSPWREDVRELALRDNVYCKLSGMVTEADRRNWTNRTFDPYLDVVFPAFGPGRLMVGSDWPVCTLAGSYGSVVGIVSDYLDRNGYGADGAGREVRSKVLGANAFEFYRLAADRESA